MGTAQRHRGRRLGPRALRRMPTRSRSSSRRSRWRRPSGRRCSSSGAPTSRRRVELRTPPRTTPIARRAALGAASASAAALLAVRAPARVARRDVIQSVSSVEVSVLAIGLVDRGASSPGATSSSSTASRSGRSIRWRRPERNARARCLRVLACGVTSAGAALGRSDASRAHRRRCARSLGIVFGALWVRDRGAWQPWAAHTRRSASGRRRCSPEASSKPPRRQRLGGRNAGWLGGRPRRVALAPVARARARLDGAGRMHAPKSPSDGAS